VQKEAKNRQNAAKKTPSEAKNGAIEAKLWI
jgi:hypothetical protein